MMKMMVRVIVFISCPPPPLTPTGLSSTPQRTHQGALRRWRNDGFLVGEETDINLPEAVEINKFLLLPPPPPSELRISTTVTETPRNQLWGATDIGSFGGAVWRTGYYPLMLSVAVVGGRRLTAGDPVETWSWPWTSILTVPPDPHSGSGGGEDTPPSYLYLLFSINTSREEEEMRKIKMEVVARLLWRRQGVNILFILPPPFPYVQRKFRGNG